LAGYGDSEKKKYSLAKLSVLCCSKDQGGLDIHDLEVKNTILLGKWPFKLLTEDATWQTILKKEIYRLKSIITCSLEIRRLAFLG
jgi:hypothetical protein